MANIVIYHGSDLKVDKPVFHYEKSNKHNDYGLGFYCTRDIEIAKEWANRKTTQGYLNKYSINERNLTILDLTDKNKYNVLNWIAILLHNREISHDIKIEYKDAIKFLEEFYIDVTKYDVVIGYRADDAYFRFPSMFIKNQLTYERLEEIYLNGNLGKQYVLISEKSYKHIKYISSSIVDSIYHSRYLLRKDNADNSYKLLEINERTRNGKRINDLMREKR